MLRSSSPLSNASLPDGSAPGRRVALVHRLAACLLCLCAAGGAGPARAAAPVWPERPVRIVVPLPAGTSPDIFARHLGQKLSAVLRQTVVIENRPGANSVIGTAVVARASADGHTLLHSSIQHVMLKPLLGKLPFDPDADFTPVKTTTATEMVLLVPASSRFASAADIVAHVRSRPGELNFSSPGIGSPAHLAGQAFLSATGMSARHIPMKGSTESVTATAGGQVDYTITAISNALALIQGGKVRPLATTGAQRHRQLPAVPIMAEAAPPGFVFDSWSAIFAPRGTPPAVLALLPAARVLPNGAAELLEERSAARKAKDFAASDRLRDKLAAIGVLVEDGRDGQRWRLK